MAGLEEKTPQEEVQGQEGAQEKMQETAQEPEAQEIPEEVQEVSEQEEEPEVETPEQETPRRRSWLIILALLAVAVLIATYFATRTDTDNGYSTPPVVVEPVNPQPQPVPPATATKPDWSGKSVRGKLKSNAAQQSKNQDEINKLKGQK